jgi:stearoyl-CoA desaturase (delta-9 desaturase)
MPVYSWNESWTNSLFVATLFRYVFILNVTWLVNSAAHMFGNKPYDKFITPVENMTVAVLTYGEGWHNYHHTFPWDYKAAELKYFINPTTAFIDFFAKIGWATELKTLSNDIVKSRAMRTGDGSHPIWGWGDTDQHKTNRDCAVITSKRK